MEIIVIAIMILICCCCFYIIVGFGFFILSSSAKKTAPTTNASTTNASTITKSTITTPTITTPTPITYSFNKLENITSLPGGIPIGTSNADYKDLGVQETYNDCETKALTDPDISKFQAISWHANDFGPGNEWNKRCYAINNTNNFMEYPKITTGLKKQTPSTKDKFTIKENTNCIHGRVPKAYTSTNNYHYIGKFDTYTDCMNAALADPNIDKTEAITYHSSTFPNNQWAKVCYTINDKNTNVTESNTTCGIKTSV